jgi:hypothetical protein
VADEMPVAAVQALLRAPGLAQARGRLPLAPAGQRPADGTLTPVSLSGEPVEESPLHQRARTAEPGVSAPREDPRQPAQ